MTNMQPEQRSIPEISPDKVSFVMEKARQFLADKDESIFAADPPEDGVSTKDLADAPMRAEFSGFVDGLDIDEQNALVALAWIGRGDFEPEHWPAAVALAGERREQSVSTYLMGLPLLPEYLEEALAEYGLSARDSDPVD